MHPTTLYSYCKEKVDLNIQVYNTVLQQGLTILVRFCCEECQFLPPPQFGDTYASYNTLFILLSVSAWPWKDCTNFSKKCRYLYILSHRRSGSCLLIDNSTFAEDGATIFRS